jgi:regulator of sigma E protease
VTPERTPPLPAREAEATAARAADVPDDAQLSAGAWLRRNGVYLLAAAALAVFVYSRFGLEGMWAIFLVCVGLGLVIFIHELGHFAVAKWCDVYVQTFSIGFGPALPGCKLKWGETVYKISLLPLGGYVQMLGEGTDSDEGEDNPRSYKNKPVGQRMMIISAGVVMNVLLACLCFIVVFMGPGKERPAGVIGWTEPGNQAWKKGIPSGAVLTRVGNRQASPGQPLYFTDLLAVVLSSTEGEKIPIDYDVYPPGGDPAKPEHHEVLIEPRKEGKADRPMIGVSPPDSVELYATFFSKERPFPYQADSGAAAARQAFPWHPGDVALAATDPEHPESLSDLPRPADDADGRRATAELARRWYALAGQPMTLRLRRKGGRTDEVVTKPGAFAFGDTIVGATDPDHPDEVTALPTDPRNPGGKLGDFFEFSRRLQLLSGRFLVIRVRHHDQREEDLLVPPAYHVTLGTRMRLGQVAGIREGSAAAEAGVLDGDFLKEVHLKGTGDKGPDEKHFVLGEGNPANLIDPTRLPSELRRWADSHTSVQAVLTVVHTNSQQGLNERQPETLKPVPWDAGWRFDRELLGSPSAPLAIPELGLAYRVGTLVEDVAPGSPAASRLQKHDVIKALRYKRLGAKADQWTDGKWEDLDNDQWARVFTTFQRLDNREVSLKVERGGKEEQVTLTLERDFDWPMDDRGLALMPDFRKQRASNPAQAIRMGADETLTEILDVYRGLRGLATRRIGVENAGGPIKIAALAYSAASAGIWELLFFLGVISINLAVINFLPIPFLDGGHMVFLIYEKIRGRPPQETVMAFATYAGLLFLLVVMALVLFGVDLPWVFRR